MQWADEIAASISAQLVNIVNLDSQLELPNSRHPGIPISAPSHCRMAILRPIPQGGHPFGSACNYFPIGLA